VLPVGSIIEDGATLTGLLAGAMAVGGFLAHARPVLQRRDEVNIRIATVIGGLIGFGIASIAMLSLELDCFCLQRRSEMNERTALTLVFAVSMAAVVAALAVLSVLGARSQQMALAYVVILCVAADAGARVVLHYRR
jgi:hypothetical protein